MTYDEMIEQVNNVIEEMNAIKRELYERKRQPNIPDGKKLLTVEEASKRIGVPPSCIRSWCKNKEKTGFPAKKVEGGRWRIFIEKFDDWFENYQEASA